MRAQFLGHDLGGERALARHTIARSRHLSRSASRSGSGSAPSVLGAGVTAPPASSAAVGGWRHSSGASSVGGVSRGGSVPQAVAHDAVEGLRHQVDVRLTEQGGGVAVGRVPILVVGGSICPAESCRFDLRRACLGGKRHAPTSTLAMGAFPTELRRRPWPATKSLEVARVRSRPRRRRSHRVRRRRRPMSRRRRAWSHSTQSPPCIVPESSTTAHSAARRSRCTLGRSPATLPSTPDDPCATGDDHEPGRDDRRDDDVSSPGAQFASIRGLASGNCRYIAGRQLAVPRRPSGAPVRGDSRE